MTVFTFLAIFITTLRTNNCCLINGDFFWRQESTARSFIFGSCSCWPGVRTAEMHPPMNSSRLQPSSGIFVHYKKLGSKKQIETKGQWTHIRINYVNTSKASRFHYGKCQITMANAISSTWDMGTGTRSRFLAGRVPASRGPHAACRPRVWDLCLTCSSSNTEPLQHRFNMDTILRDKLGKYIKFCLLLRTTRIRDNFGGNRGVYINETWLYILQCKKVCI